MAETETPIKLTDHNPAEPTLPGVTEPSRFSRFKLWYWSRRRWSLPASFLLLLALLAITPLTRYFLAGLVLRRDFSVQVLDDTTGTPISRAKVTLGRATTQTDGTGRATLHDLKPGTSYLNFSKTYYKSFSATATVPIFSKSATVKAKLTATGRQVKLNVRNIISRQTLGGVDISVAGISAKTDKAGSATVVVPAGFSEQSAVLRLSGYNDSRVTLKVSGDKIAENDYNLTPYGKIYFLSKLSGTIDVVKTNLDGTDRQTILAGTGREDNQNTVMLASRDWKYLALLSRRAGSIAAIYLIDTSNDSLTTIDQENASFQPLGWSDNYFSYVANRSGIQPWQPKAASIISYNAAARQLNILDSTAAAGTNYNDAIYETYFAQPLLMDNVIIYAKNWYKYPGYPQPSGQTNSLNSIRPNGTGKKQLKTFDSDKFYTSNLVFHNPRSVYVQTSQPNPGNSNYYELSDSGQLASKDSLSPDDFFKPYPVYLYSPSGKQTFWAEPRDGKNTLFIGDDSGQNPKQIASLSEYTPYGWYSDNYLLVSKNSSQLYIMPKTGGSAIKITDFHKPESSFSDYGGV